MKSIIAWANLFRLWPHLVVFVFYYNICKDDIIRTAKLSLECRQFAVYEAFVKLMTFNKYYRNLYYYRIGNFQYFISFLAPKHPCFTIGTHTVIGRGLRLEHPFASIINAESIGDGFEIRNNVTIGAKNGHRPVIKNNVVVNVNSAIIGGITIGNNVVIGAGTIQKRPRQLCCYWKSGIYPQTGWG